MNRRGFLSRCLDRIRRRPATPIAPPEPIATAPAQTGTCDGCGRPDQQVEKRGPVCFPRIDLETLQFVKVDILLCRACLDWIRVQAGPGGTVDSEAATPGITRRLWAKAEARLAAQSIEERPPVLPIPES